MKSKTRLDAPQIGTTTIYFSNHIASKVYNKITFDTFRDFYKVLKETCEETPDSTDKKKLPAIATGADYLDNHVNVASCRFVKLFCIDIDTGNLSKEDLSIPYTHIIHQSNSSTPTNKKWRIFIPLLNPIEDGFKENYDANVKKLFGDIEYDRSCSHTAAKFYIPSQKQAKTFELHENLPIYDYDISIAVKTESEKTYEEFNNPRSLILADTWRRVERIVDEVERTGKDITGGYDGWFRIGMAIASISKFDFDRGLDAFTKISNKLEGHESTPEHIKEKFTEWCRSNKEITIATFFKAAIDNEIIKKRDEKIIDHDILYLVKPEGSENLYHLAYKNTKTDHLVKLESHRFFMPDVIARLESDIISKKDRYELNYEDITYVITDPETGDEKIKVIPQAKIKVNYAVPANETGYLLGAESLGHYAEKGHEGKVTILQAQHCIRKDTPKFDQDIDDFISQLPYDKKWFEKYIYWFRKCEYGLPMLYSYGFSKSGKSFLAELFATLFSSGYNNAYFDVRGYCQSGGNSPIIFLDEKIPCDAITLKKMIGSRITEINQKNKGRIVVRGFYRFMATENSNEPNLPSLGENEDKDALERRIQFGKFEREHTDYLKQIPTKTQEAWIHEDKFLKHCEYICQKLDGLEPENAIFAIEPYSTPEMLGGTALSKTDQLIRQEVIKVSRGTIGSDKKESPIDVSALKSNDAFLRNNEIINMTEVVFAKRIRQIFHRKGKVIRIVENSNGTLTVRIPKEILIKVKEKLHNFDG